MGPDIKSLETPRRTPPPPVVQALPLPENPLRSKLGAFPPTPEKDPATGDHERPAASVDVAVHPPEAGGESNASRASSEALPAETGSGPSLPPSGSEDVAVPGSTGPPSESLTVSATPVTAPTPVGDSVVPGSPRATRWAAALAGSALVSLLLAGFETLWARNASTASPPRFGTWLSALGLMAPVVLGVGVAVGALVLFVHPIAPPGLSRLRAVLSPADPRRRRHLAALAILVPLVSVASLLVMARAALGILVWDSSAPSAGVALGLTSMGLGMGALLTIFGGERLIAVQWRHPPPSPLHLAVAVTGFSVVVLAIIIGLGTTSGAGGTLRMFGVLKRPELDLRAPALLLLLAMGAYLAPALHGLLEARGRFVRAPWLLAVGLSPLLATGYAAVGGLQDGEVALAVERGTALGKRTLSPFRRVADRDGDGFSAWFGGGDCNDSSPSVNPGADDVPDNGKDEDCSGKDAEPVDLGSANAQPASAQDWIRQKLPAKPNVLVLSVDTLRADALGIMGYKERAITPSIDALAARSSLFTHAYSIASYTGKSIGPTVIGKYTSETNRGWSHFNHFPKEIFVQERLQKAGIRTISCQGYWYLFQKGSGFERGFDVMDSSAAPPVAKVNGDRSSTSDKLSDAIIAQLSDPKNVGRQFYLWAHYTDPHVEYVRHQEFDFGTDARALYDSEVAFVDKHLERVLDFVKSSDIAERTVIIVWSDHGEAFGEHGMIRHGFELWEPLVRVPLIVHVPGMEPHRVEVRRGLIDLVPTVLDIFGVPLPAGEDALSGTSLLEDVLKPPGYEPRDRIVFIDMSAGPYNADRQAFIDHSMKLMASNGQPLGLYDLARDPGETKNLLKDKALSGPVIDRFKAFRRQLRVVQVRPQ